ncbi:hypothetical protein [Pseudodesulfovibrio nedwellii]|uniref:hypothetical protein n=1 Tax=Pseudodesulfovibrio nedwellii TaxID=2973072 RepID=UPI00248F9F52|nr:hypothetical protein [Pseudodesulfovibrio nedwellii]
MALEQNQDKIDEITTNFDSFFKEKRDRIESKLRIIAPISGNHYNQIQDIINDFEDAHWEHFSMVTNNEKGTGLQSAAFGYETTLYTGLNKTLRTLYLLNNSDDLSNFFGFEITFKEKIFRNGKRAFKGVINGTHNLAQKKNAICYTPFTNNNAIPQLDEPAYMYKLKFLRALRERACCDITFPTEELKRVHKEDGKIWACKMFILMTICHVILWLSSPIWFPLCATRKWWKLTNELPNMETDMEWKAAMIIQRPELFSRIY